MKGKPMTYFNFNHHQRIVGFHADKEAQMLVSTCLDIEASCCEVWARGCPLASGDNRLLDDFGWATRQSHRKFYEWLIKGIEAGRVLTALPLKTPSHFQPYDYFALLMATQTSVASSVRNKSRIILLLLVVEHWKKRNNFKARKPINTPMYDKWS